MKAYINLMASEVLFDEKPFSIGQAAIPLVSGALVLSLVILFGGFYLQAQGLRKEVNELAIQKDQIQRKTAQMNRDIQALVQKTGVPQQTASQQIAAVKGLLENRIRWSDLIRELSRIVPDGVWLSRIESAEGGSVPNPVKLNQKRMLFVGLARNQEGVNRFIAALEQSPRYETVTLIFSQENRGQDRDHLAFEIMADFKE